MPHNRSPRCTVNQATPNLVPRGYLCQIQQDRWARDHLRYLMQKHQLGQDVFLTGPPSPLKRTIAMAFCEMLNMQVETVNLSRDICESDLKQRRELDSSGTLQFVSMPPLAAAIHGRILFIDGVEKAERNVLPVLNNLLENREMSLLDGRRLVSASFFEHTLSKLGISEDTAASELGLIPASRKFQVIATGAPVPPFTGYPMDPPFRSRFSGRFFNVPIDFGLDRSPGTNQVPEVQDSAANESIKQVVANVRALATSEKKMHHLPANASERMSKSLQASPNASLDDVFRRCFPFHRVLADDAALPLMEVLSQLEWKSNVHRDTTETLADKMSAEYQTGSDLCLIGERGSGKTALVKALAKRLGYGKDQVQTVACYKDMNSPSLTVKRVTNPDKSTHWQKTPLIQAAMRGDFVILDGVDRLEPDILASIQHLVLHRDIALASGERLQSAEKIAGANLEIHDSFRIVAIGEPPKGSNQWLSPDAMNMFSFFEMPPIELANLAKMVESKANMSSSDSKALLKGLVEDRKIRISCLPRSESNVECELTMSLRQVLRTAQLLQESHATLDEILQRVLLIPFMPIAKRQGFLELCRAKPFGANTYAQQPRGNRPSWASAKVGSNANVDSKAHLLPKVDDFVYMPHQVDHMKAIEADLAHGHHVLLIGNQGTGKNKLTDKMLQDLRRHREYFQLSRDSSVQSLTVAASLVNDVLTYIDSPVVRAVENGHVLVLDEADKAAKEVVAILKGLLNDQEMYLVDGRKVGTTHDADIRIHPDFRVVCLANRPGFPFLGNDFFSELGDSFSPHIIDNGSIEDQKLVLQSVAPEMPQIDAVVRSFHALRELADEGVLKYPFSTREAVHVARHVARYPSDGLRVALENIFAFDRLDGDSMELIHDAFAENGILVGKQQAPVVLNLSPERPLGESREREAKASYLTNREATKEYKISGRDVSFLLEVSVAKNDASKERRVGRVSEFSEETVAFHHNAQSPPPRGSCSVQSIASTCDTDTLHVLSSRPDSVSSTNLATLETKNIDISKLVGVGAHIVLGSLDNANIVLVCLKSGRAWLFDPKLSSVKQFSLPREFVGKVPESLRPLANRELLFESHQGDSILELVNARGRLLLGAEEDQGDGEHGSGLLLTARFFAGEASGNSKKKLLRNSRFCIKYDNDEVVIKDVLRSKKKTLSPRYGPIRDACFHGEEHLSILYEGGRVSVIELDHLATEAALEAWLDQFSDTALSDDNDIVFETDGGGSIPDIPLPAPIQIQGSDGANLGGGAGRGIGSGGGGPGGGSGGGGGVGDPIDRSDGWGGYSSSKLEALLGEVSLERRLELGLPVAASELVSNSEFRAKEGDTSIASTALENQLRREVMASKGDPRAALFYKRVQGKVARQIKELKLVFESAEAKEKERSWLANKAAGELDEEKLVDARCGDSFVFRARGEAEKMQGLVQAKPKRLLFLLDTSASMARANDERLDRLLESTVMIMESLDSFRDKFEYAVACHSGTSPFIPLLFPYGRWPSLEQRVEATSRIQLNARSAVTGDHTLESLRLGIESVVKDGDADDYFVVLISDANLGRYDVSPHTFGRVLTSDPRVHAHAIFLAEPSAGEWLSSHLPLGTGHLCLDPGKLPQVLAEIFRDAVES